jgi:hypothetical protein
MLLLERQPRDRAAHASENIVAAGRREYAGGNAADAAEPDNRHRLSRNCRRCHGPATLVIFASQKTSSRSGNGVPSHAARVV